MRCLIIGADGTFGAALADSLRQGGHEVIATTRRRHLAIAGGSFYLDLAEELPSMPEADVAVICAAMARFEDCRRYPERAHRVNVAAPLALARSLTEAGARVILLSTGVVFDCKTPHVSESAEPAPRSVYGRLKAEAEACLLDLGSLVSVLRLTKVVRPNAGVLSEWIRHLGEGKIVRAFDDHRFSPLTVAHVVDALVALVERGEGGIYHASGAADVSYAEAARFLARQIGVPSQLVEGVRGVDNGLADGDLTPFTSLATTRLSDLTGFIPPQPLEVLQTVFGREISQAKDVLAALAR
ncbi:sugar nucleotide-binding protein [Bradyrhizobium sp. Tv2a-2]|uniref:SDR family oxidoreductase n=1 Tax=Bradyrhizobium sp. Tv2a-2 TaxID=113395 RepID=UPI0004659812|nr:sugar nucleotide-binding protein [Bradyrhizobium sp. Tv2a-2]